MVYGRDWAKMVESTLRDCGGWVRLFFFLDRFSIITPSSHAGVESRRAMLHSDFRLFHNDLTAQWVQKFPSR